MSEPLVDRLVAGVSLPDALVRPVVRGGIAARILRERARQRSGDPVERFAARRRSGPIAIETQAANDQHYEVTPPFYQLTLGPRLKYSSCLFDATTATLAQAEAAMLALTCERAGLRDGMRILELGCGWGSLTLWMAEKYPTAQITAVSNSAPQRRFIEGRAAAGGMDNVEVVTADVNQLDLGRRFERVVSVEMFEHVRNHRALLDRVDAHLEPDGALFVHVFAHRARGYEFEDSWMTRRFFSGGVMPVHGWLDRVGGPLRIERQWWLDGTHYAQTGRAWLDNLDANHEACLSVLADAYGAEAAPGRLRDWRLFFLACEEIFAFRGGREYGVSHALLRRVATS